MFGYLTACKVQLISDNDPQVIIYMLVSMPFHRPDHAYTVNRICRGYIWTLKVYTKICVLCSVYYRRVR